MKMSHQHLFDAAVLQVVFDGGKSAEDDTLHSFKVILQAQHIKETVDGMQRLFHLFDKEDDVVFRCQMYLRACNGGIARQVASHQDSLCMAAPVIGMTWNLVLWQGAEKDITDNRSGWLLTASYLKRHRTMNTRHASIGNRIKQHGDVAMTDKPFGVLFVTFHGNAVEQMNGAVTAARTNDCLDTVVFERPKQVGSTLIGRSRIRVHIKIVGVWSYHRLQSPPSDGFCSLLKGFLRHPIGRRDKCNFVACI